MTQTRKCETVSLDNLPKDFEKVALRWADARGTYTIIGASTLFMAPLVTKKAKTAFQGTNFTVRGMPALKWSVCLSDDDTPIDVYFSDPKHSPYGSVVPVPLRIVQEKEVSDIMMMQDYVTDTDDVFKIPAGRGCARIKTRLPKPPSFANVSFEFHSEVMFRNLQSSPDFYYTSHLDIIRDTSSDHMSAIVEPWATSERNAQPSGPTGSYQEIFDYYNGILYTIYKLGHQDTCTVTATNGYMLNVSLPGLGKLDMLNHLVRGMPTHAFELLQDGLDGRASKITQATITYYYLQDDWIWDRDLSHRNIPVKIAARTFTTSQQQLKPFYELTLNIHDLTTVMERMNEKMNVLSCYDENDQSYTWFQVGFPRGKSIHTLGFVFMDFICVLFISFFFSPASANDVETAVLSSPAVKEAFLRKLYEVSELTPLRVPRVLIDYTSNMVFLTALILERPAITDDYICSSTGPECTAVSYCGASCYTTSMYSEDDTHNLEKSVDCDVYAKTKLGLARKLPITLDAIQNVVQAVASSKFVLLVRHRIASFRVLTLTAETTHDSMGSLSHTFGASDEETRERHKRIGPSVPAPTGRPPAGDTEKKTECAIFSKRYTNSFNVFEGMSLDMKARKFADVPANEDCARLCLYEKEFECKSFDYCTMTRDPATVCRLHDTHLREYGDPAKLDAKNAEKCFPLLEKVPVRLQEDEEPADNGPPAVHRHQRGVRPKSALASAGRPRSSARTSTSASPPASRTWASERAPCTFAATSRPRPIMSPVCSTYAYTGNPDLIQPKVYALSASLHSNATAGGLSFFMVLLGIGIGAAALFAYGFYRAHQANRV
ncbi:hypothetical protein MRX96_042379 [Rhipicephalus microplus]